MRHFSELVRFLAVFFLYSAGLTSVVAFAGIYALAVPWASRSEELTFLFLLLQLSSAAGAFIFGWVQDRLGADADDPDHAGALDPGLRRGLGLRRR